jgi:hypothetical protein
MLKDNNVNGQITKGLVNLLETVLHQNYFHYNGNIYKPKTGIAMGSPLSGIIVEIFLQNLEQLRLKHILESKAIIYYTRYVDDIFLIYNPDRITPELIQELFNKQHKAIQFIITEENNNKISYLDLNISNTQGTIEINIFGKPTATDITISNTSCHPGEHKMAMFKNWLHRLHKLPLSNANKTKEFNTILNIAENNGYNRQFSKATNEPIQQRRKTEMDDFHTFGELHPDYHKAL